MGIDLRPTCSKCGKIIDLTDMRAAGDGKFICKDCFGKKDVGFNPLKKNITQEFKRPRVRPVDHTAVEPIASEDTFFAQKEYICTSCGYTFKRAPTKMIKHCPFCGKDSVQEKVDTYSNDFIQ